MFEPGQVIYPEGEKPAGIYVIRRGDVKATKRIVMTQRSKSPRAPVKKKNDPSPTTSGDESENDTKNLVKELTNLEKAQKGGNDMIVRQTENGEVLEQKFDRMLEVLKYSKGDVFGEEAMLEKPQPRQMKVTACMGGAEVIFMPNEVMALFLPVAAKQALRDQWKFFVLPKIKKTVHEGEQEICTFKDRYMLKCEALGPRYGHRSLPNLNVHTLKNLLSDASKSLNDSKKQYIIIANIVFVSTKHFFL